MSRRFREASSFYFHAEDYPLLLTSVFGFGTGYENYVVKLASKWVIELVEERLLAMVNTRSFFKMEDRFHLLKLLKDPSFFELSPHIQSAFRINAIRLEDSLDHVLLTRF